MSAPSQGIIDCDIHPTANDVTVVLPYVPQQWKRRFEDTRLVTAARSPERWPYPGGNPLRQDTIPPDGGLPASDPGFAREELLDPFGIVSALMLPAQPSAVNSWTDVDAATVFVAAMNEYFLEHWYGFDDRYKLAVTIAPQDPVAAAAAIRGYADRPGVVAVFMPLIDKLLGSKHFHPIYAAAEETGLPIVLHPTGAEGAHPLAMAFAGTPRSFGERIALLPQLAHSNLVSLIFEGTFERFPQLSVAFIEFGFSWVPPALWRIDANWENFRYSVPWVKRPPVEYVLEHVRFTTQPLDEPSNFRDLWALMDMLQADRTLMFSSDYPHYDNDDPSRTMRLVPEHLRSRVCFENAHAFFGERLGLGVPSL
jgi:uncharacterized protein